MTQAEGWLITVWSKLSIFIRIVRAAGANENARYLCKCVGLQDGMKQNDEIDLYALRWSHFLFVWALLGLMFLMVVTFVGLGLLCWHEATARPDSDLTQTVKDCLGILHFVAVRASPGDTRDREVKDEERGEKFEIRIFSI